MSSDIITNNSPEAILEAARIWATATARRDGLSQPVPADRKLPGLQAALAAPGASLHMARQEHLPVGFLVLVPSDARLELRYLGVAPSAWGNGVAARLLAHVARVAKTGGFETAELWVLAENERAIAVYARAGWARTTDARSQIDTRRTENRLELHLGGHASRQ